MVNIPQFVRFVDVTLYYCYRCDTRPIEEICKLGFYLQLHDSLTIEEMCHLIVIYFQPLKMAPNKSHLTNFIGKIDENDPCEFNTHLQLLSHVQEEFLPIFNSSLGYRFTIYFSSDRNSGTNVISSILQMPPIQHSSNVEIILFGLAQPIQLPVESISNFLHQKYDGIHENSKDRYLRINLPEIQNVHATCEHFKKVINQNF